MPSFWTADVPLALIQVRIQPATCAGDDGRRTLAVPSTVYSALYRIYASIRAGGFSGSNGKPCIVEVTKDIHDDDGSLACLASGSTWSVVGTNADCLDEEGGFGLHFVAATLEAVVPVELSEVVFGVSSSQYDAALAARDIITMQIKGQSRLYYEGYHITVATSEDSRELVTLRCLMCQPVSQGIVYSNSSSTRIILVKSLSAEDSSNMDSQAAEPSTEDNDVLDVDQWDIGAEWLILGDSPSFDNRDRHIEINAVTLATPVDNSQLVPAAYPGEDCLNRGYMSLAALAKTGIVSGGWILVSSSAKTEKSPEASDTSCLHDNQRAIRVFGLSSSELADDTLALPPMLFQNVYGQIPSSSPASVTISPLGMPPALPCPAYLGHSDGAARSKTNIDHQPPFETARKVVLARVSSPLSERKDLEVHALAALQRWLSPDPPSDDAKDGSIPLRVVKTGDLIAVRIELSDANVRTGIALMADADMANRVRSGDPNADPNAIDVNPVTDLALEMLDGQGSSIQGADADGYVFFRVDSVEGFKRGRAAYGLGSIMELDSDYDDGSYEDDASDSDDDSDDDEATHIDPASVDSRDRKWAQWYNLVRNKGFIVQPDVTMVVQAGATRCRVPYSSVRTLAIAGKYADHAQMDALQLPYSSELDRLRRLANTSLHPLAITHKLVCSVLLKGNPGTGKRFLVSTVAEQLGIHLYELSCYDILADSEDKTAQILEVYFQNACRYTPCILHLRSIEALAQASNAQPGQENADDLPISRVLRKCIEDISKAHKDTGFPVVVVASSNQPDKIPASLAAAFRYEIELGVPDERTRLMLLKSIVRTSLPLAPDADIAYVAQQTASFVARDLVMLTKRAESHAWKRTQKKAPEAASKQLDTSSSLPFETRDLVVSGHTITNDDLLEALGDARASMSDTLGVPKIPNVKWDDVGGLADAKKDILDTIRLPMEQPHLFASGLSTRSGLLFYGPPGTGKTLLAKAIATECGLNFFSCKGPELISPYIGESEANVRRIFQKAREASPCVIFFDELDSLAPKRGQQGDSGGVMDRIVSQLLAELDGMSGGGGSGDKDTDNADEKSDQKTAGDNSPASAVQVFAIGATNRPDLLDPALLRPGRFDKLVYLGVSETHEAQHNIIQALTRKFHLHPDLDLRQVSEKCPFHYTGADFYALCSDALLKAMLRTVDEVDELIKQWNADDTREPNEEHPVPMTPQYYLDHIAAESVKQVTVTAGDFDKALDELIPSVSAEELVRYQALRQQFDSALKGKDKQTAAPAAFESDDRSIQYPEDQFQSHSTNESTDIRPEPSADSLTSATKKGKAKNKGKGKAPA
ncbi:peroxisomal assembly protein [Coemansia interrupta]|uniref:Peroxisomal ATPase PEX6 n=1 Tax=Coemansia interrupta TaxID=1126814 RepID=A0A9W8HJV5_9FUNG|nr:peroxisomal assembly protein [Coemansia interrupta]